MSEVVRVVKQLPVERTQGVTLQVQRLTTTVEETSRFLQAFGKQGFLKKMMAGQLDAEKFGECSESFILSYNMIIQLYIAELPANPLPCVHSLCAHSRTRQAAGSAFDGAWLRARPAEPGDAGPALREDGRGRQPSRVGGA